MHKSSTKSHSNQPHHYHDDHHGSHTAFSSSPFSSSSSSSSSSPCSRFRVLGKPQIPCYSYAHLERKTTQRLLSPQRKDGLTDGRMDGQTDSWEHERQKKEKTTAVSFAATMCHNTEEVAKSLFSRPKRKTQN
jgi:hypothetical protein